MSRGAFCTHHPSYIVFLYWFTYNHGHRLLHRVDKQLCIKVADFGLARDVYTTDYYRQQSDGKIPAKWMAPEALHDKISNEKTDVVSLLIN